MICTGENAKVKLYLTNDINSSNFDFIQSCYTDSDLYITSKFSMPDVGFEICCGSSELAWLIESETEDIMSMIKAGRFSIMQSETQLENFRIKAYFWIYSLFSKLANMLENRDDTEQITVMVDNGTVSKHEWLFLQIISKLDNVRVIVISSNADKLNADIALSTELKKECFTTSEHLDYRSGTERIAKSVKQAVGDLVVSVPERLVDITLDELEQAVYEENNPIKVVCYGIGNYKDTCNFYGKLHNTCLNNSSCKLVMHKFDRPTSQEVSRIQNIPRRSGEFVVHTLGMYINTGNTSWDNSLRKGLKQIYESGAMGDNAYTSPDIIYNKVVFILVVLNRILSDELKTFVYYGSPEKNDKLVLETLASIPNIKVIVLSSDKSNMQKMLGFSIFEQQSSIEYFDMPMTDSRDNVVTYAAQAQQRVNETLFNGDILGMYKPGMFKTCRTVRFSTTFDELKAWWNRELYIRPGFKVENDVAVIPTLFTLVLGVPDTTSKESYVGLIEKFCSGKVVFAPSADGLSVMRSPKANINVEFGIECSCVNYSCKASVCEFYSNGKLHKDKIKLCPNYQYRYLMINKQNMILDAIETIINSEMINYKSLGLHKEDFVDVVLNTLLNLNTQLLQLIQWFEFYTYNPNVVLTLTDDQILTLEHMILLQFASLIGFDVLIFVPTKYSSIESYVSPSFQYDCHDIGLARYDIRTTNIVLNKYEVVPREWQSDASASASGGSKKKNRFLSWLLS